MKKISAADLDPRVWSLFDDYVHGRIRRREFLDRVPKMAAAGLSAAAILDFLSPRYAEATQVPPDDPRLRTQKLTYTSKKGGGEIRGLLAWPAKGKKKLPAVVVVHENRGLNPHIEDVARRAALAGFLALAPDALTPLGGYPGNDDDGRALQSKRDRGEMLEDFIAAFAALEKHPRSTGKVGVVGFCFGGWIANMMAVRVPTLRAAVPFYGGQPDAADVPAIKAPLLLHFGSLDERVNAGWPAYEAALKENKKTYTAHFYENANHGFHNDTTPRYDKAAAELAWKRTVDFLKRHLG